MEKTLISAYCYDIRKTERYIYCLECRQYATTKYRIYIDKYHVICSVFDTREEAEQVLRDSPWHGRVESMDWVDIETLPHRYTRKGR